MKRRSNGRDDEQQSEDQRSWLIGLHEVQERSYEGENAEEHMSGVDGLTRKKAKVATAEHAVASSVQLQLSSVVCIRAQNLSGPLCYGRATTYLSQVLKTSTSTYLHHWRARSRQSERRCRRHHLCPISLRFNAWSRDIETI